MKCYTPRKKSTKTSNVKVEDRHIAQKATFKHLSQVFKKQGINATLVADPYLNGKANVVKEGKTGNVTITYNPQRADNESIFHEFGHLYVELIDEPDFIKLGVEQLRGTKLWDKVAAANPTYSGIMLEHEVLTTAIGEATTNIENSPIRFWINRLFQRIAELFNINVDVAQKLAYDMVNHKLSKKIDSRIEMVKQWQRDDIYAADLDIATKFIEDKLKPLKALQRNTVKTIKHQKFTSTTKELLSKINGYVNKNNRYADLTQLEAISAITKYDIEWIQDVESRLQRTIEQYKNNTDLRTITRDEIASLGDTVENIETFLDTFVHIDNLESFNKSTIEALLDVASLGKDGGVIQHYTAKEGLSESDTEIANTLAKLSNVRVGLAARVNAAKARNRDLRVYFGASVVAQSTNKKTARDAMNFYKSRLTDESQFQRLFMNNLDSTNAFIANVGRINAKYEKEAIHKKVKMIAKFNKMVDGLSIDDIKKLYTKDDGELSTFLIGEYDYLAFKEFLKKEQSGAKTEEERRLILNRVSNSLTSTEIDKLMSDKNDEVEEGKITQEEYDRWQVDNFVYNPQLDRFDTRLFGEYRKPKDDKFKTQGYQNLQNSPDSKLSKLHKYLLDTQKELTSHTDFTMQYRGAIPIIDYKEIEQLFNDSGIAVDDNGRPLRSIRLLNVGEHIAKRYIHIPQFDSTMQTEEEYKESVLEQVNILNDSNFKSIEEIEEFNEALKVENKKLYEKAVSYDLKTIFPLFIESSLDHQYRSKIENLNLTTLAALKEVQLQRIDLEGNIVKNVTAYNKDGSKKDATKAGDISNIAHRFEIDMTMKLYGNFTKKAKANKSMQQLRNLTANLGLGFNVHAAAKNLGMGYSQLYLEARAGIQYGTKDLNKGRSNYRNVIPTLFRDRHGETTDNYTVGLMKYFNVIDDYSELADKANNLSVIREEESQGKTLKKKALKTWNNLAFSPTILVEHQLHNVTLLAMLNSHRVIDGEIVSRFDYINHNKQLDLEKMNDTNYVNKFIADGKEHKKAAIKEFEKTGIPLNDAFELIDGVIEIKNVDGQPVVGKEGLLDFELKVQGVNHKLHGIYNKSDKGIVEHSTYGQSIMQFKHWLPAMWAERFGASGNPFSTETTYNERRQEHHIGNYNAFFKMVKKAVDPYKQDARSSDGSLALLEGLEAYAKGILKFVTNARVYYHSMNEYEKAKLMKAINEIGLGLAFSLSLVGISMAVPDDDKDSIAYNFPVYVLRGVKQELHGLTPGYGWFETGVNTVSNPAAALTHLKTAAQGTLRMIGAGSGILEPRFQSGPHKGNLKFVDDYIKLTPGATQIRRWLLFTEKNHNQTYSLINL